MAISPQRLERITRAWRRLRSRYHYSDRSPGFLRMNICGWRLVFIDTRKHIAVYSDRAHGWKVGPFLFRANNPGCPTPPATSSR